MRIAPQRGGEATGTEAAGMEVGSCRHTANNGQWVPEAHQGSDPKKTGCSATGLGSPFRCPRPVVWPPAMSRPPTGTGGAFLAPAGVHQRSQGWWQDAGHTFIGEVGGCDRLGYIQAGGGLATVEARRCWHHLRHHLPRPGHSTTTLRRARRSASTRSRSRMHRAVGSKLCWRWEDAG